MYGYIDELRIGTNWADVTPPSTPGPLTFCAVLSSNNVSCNGGNNGSITVRVAGGTPPLQFSDDDGNTWTQGTNPYNYYTFNNLAAGSYTLQAQDANLNTVAYSGNPVILTQPRRR